MTTSTGTTGTWTAPWYAGRERNPLLQLHSAALLSDQAYWYAAQAARAQCALVGLTQVEAF